MFFNVPIPDWESIDITPAFDYLWQLLVGLWEWSGRNGFYFHGNFIEYRWMIMASLVMVLFIERLLGTYNEDKDEMISDTESKLYRRRYDD